MPKVRGAAGGGSGGDRTEQSQRPPSDSEASLKTNEHHDTCWFEEWTAGGDVLQNYRETRGV